jgi:NAD+ diphosphatase
MIVRIVDGERILLAHNRRFPEDVYSCVAGYVEPGETLEDTVIREIREEVGLDAAPPAYIASQAWPFPHSLMLGFETTARGEPRPDGEEITDAVWFTPDNLPHIPRNGTIARTLIDGWLRNIGRL